MQMRRLVAVLVALAVLLAACSSGGGSSDTSAEARRQAEEALRKAQEDAQRRSNETENPADPDAKDTEPSLLDDPTPAIKAFEKELGELPMATEVYLYEGDYAIGEFQDPDQPENLDSYTYRDGALEPPAPVHVSQFDIDNFPNVMFGLDEVNWAAVPLLVSEALARLGPQIEGAEVSAVSVHRLGSLDQGKPTFSVSVSGTRRNGSMRATADGTVIDATVN